MYIPASVVIFLAKPVPDAIVNQGPTAPPASGAFLWGLAVITWMAFLVCMAGFARSGGHLAWAGIRPSHSGGGNAVSELAFSGVGLVVTAAAGTIVTTIAALT